MTRSGIAGKLLLTLALPVTCLAAVALWQLHKSLSESALVQLKSQMLELVQRYAAEVTAQLEKAVVIADSTAAILSTNPTSDETVLYQLLGDNLDRLSIVYGSALAFEPGRFPGKRLFSPYVYRSGSDAKARMDIALEAYDYTEPQWEWWNAPRNERRGIWTEPYFDEGAGNILMVTYSTPILKDNQFRGVATVDLDLSALHANLNLEGLRETDYVILTNTGHFAYHYRKALIGQSYVHLIDKLGLEKADYVARQMMSGENGFFEYHHGNATDWVFFAPVGHFGWSFAVRVELDDALRIAGMDKTPVYYWALLISAAAVLLTLLMAGRYVTRPLNRLRGFAEGLGQSTPADKPGHLDSYEMDSLRDALGDAAERLESRLDEADQQLSALNRSLLDCRLQLKVADKRQKTLLNAARNATFIIDPAGIVLASNDKAEKLLGKHRNEIRDAGLSRWVSTEQRSQFVDMLESMFTSLQSRTFDNLQLDLSDNTSITVNAVATPIHLPDGEIEGDVIFIAGDTLT